MCPAKLHAATFAPEDPKVLATFNLVFEERPQFDVMALNAPIGFPDDPNELRTCDAEARALLGRRRGMTVRNAPLRSTMETGIARDDERLDAITLSMLPRYADVAAEMLPFRQRTVYEAHPELSFYVINQDKPLTRSKKSESGIIERRILLEKRSRACAGSSTPTCLASSPGPWLTARPCCGRRGGSSPRPATRIPTDPEWDSEGLRKEIVR